MATFSYRCPDHGPFDAVHPIGTAPAEARCPECAGPARRLWHAPRLSSGSAPARAALDRAERSRSEPDVVQGPPPRPLPRRPAGADRPGLRRLPRP
jgi:putative FmdB family regulatory protein